MEIIINTDLFCSFGVSSKITNTKEEKGHENLNLNGVKIALNLKKRLNLSRVKPF